MRVTTLRVLFEEFWLANRYDDMTARLLSRDLMTIYLIVN